MDGWNLILDWHDDKATNRHFFYISSSKVGHGRTQRLFSRLLAHSFWEEMYEYCKQIKHEQTDWKSKGWGKGQGFCSSRKSPTYLWSALKCQRTLFKIIPRAGVIFAVTVTKKQNTIMSRTASLSTAVLPQAVREIFRFTRFFPKGEDNTAQPWSLHTAPPYGILHGWEITRTW